MLWGYIFHRLTTRELASIDFDDKLGWSIWFNRPTQETTFATPNTGKMWRQVSEEKKKRSWKGEISTAIFLATGEACKYVFWSILGLKETIFDSPVLSRGDLNLCIHSIKPQVQSHTKFHYAAIGKRSTKRNKSYSTKMIVLKKKMSV